jgi:hypothetical protein
MQKLYTIITTVLLSVLAFNVSGLQAQSVEGRPVFDVVFTPYYPENEEMPVDLRQATQPTMSVSPNPVSSETFKVWYNALMGTSQLEIYNIKGQVLHTATVGDERQRAGLYQFNASALEPGLYFIRLTSGAYQMAQKVILR